MQCTRAELVVKDGSRRRKIGKYRVLHDTFDKNNMHVVIRNLHKYAYLLKHLFLSEDMIHKVLPRLRQNHS